jgi:hypothetical protein
MFGVLGWLLFLPLGAAFGQVVSMTLAFEVNSPYGLSEPWFTLRHGLLRSTDIETVAERPDRKACTGTITTKGGKLVDLDELAKTVHDSGAGATLRVVHATINGQISKSHGGLFLRTSDAQVALRPPIEAAERMAYERLLKEDSKSIRITGPLKQEGSGESRRFSLEVREVETISKKLTPQRNL